MCGKLERRGMGERFSRSSELETVCLCVSGVMDVCRSDREELMEFGRCDDCRRGNVVVEGSWTWSLHLP